MSELYNEKWHGWEDMKKYGPTSRHQRRLIHELLSPLMFDSVLDTGCGAGDLLVEIQQKYAVNKLAGVDFSEAAVDTCKQRLPQGEFSLLDLEKNHLAKVYDLTISVDVLEHINDDESALRNIRAMTGKYFLAMSIQGDSLPAWEVTYAGHVRNYRSGEMASKIEATGFHIEKVVEWGFPFYSPLYRWFQAKTAAAGTQGEYGLLRRMIARTLYGLFWLNSSKHGDVILVLATAR